MGIIIAAIITTLLSAVAYGYLIYRMSVPEDRRVLLLAVMIMLPLQPLVFYFVRMPLHGLLQSALGPGAAVNTLALFYAPLTEEPAKWLVLLVPFIRRGLTSNNAVTVALATGLGFGIGEIWFVAERVMNDPATAALPFYVFTGFLSERFMVCFIHGATISFAFKWLSVDRSFLLGGLLGMVLHFTLNFPIFLMGANFGGIGREAWQGLLQFYIIVFTVSLAVAVDRLAHNRISASLFGSAECPECRKIYPRSWLGFNFVTTRYERCPHCRHWHWVAMKQPERNV